jgi:site-specific recombinase XerD
MDQETDTKPLMQSAILPGTTLLESLATIPEEEVWLASQKSTRTRLAYKKDVTHFMRMLRITQPEQLRQVDHRAVIAWEAQMRETEGLQSSTIRRRLSALSSLFSHLVRHGAARQNPVREVVRPQINRQQGKTLAFSRRQSRAILDAPRPPSVTWLRDRAILAVGLQLGLRRAEIVGLKVKDLHMNRGFDSLWVTRKRNKRDSIAIHPEVAKRIRDYVTACGHADDLDGAIFRPVRRNSAGQPSSRHMAPDAVDRILKTFAGVIGIERGYSAHSMRATFITTALDNGANLEDVQRDVGHADPSTTKLYDRRGHNPDKSASFFANY